MSSEKRIHEIEKFLQKEKQMYGEWDLSPGTFGTDEEAPISETDVKSEIDSPEPLTGHASAENCKTLDELHALCLDSPGLKTELEGTRMVFGSGLSDADILIIGGAPGIQDEALGEPFAGEPGQLLNKILAAVDITRQEVYITNILKHRPPDNRDPVQSELQANLPFLVRQIELVDPKIILCLGLLPASTLLKSRKTLNELRGKFHPFMGRELMVTYHPATLLQDSKLKRPVWEDVKKMKKKYDERI